MFNKLHYDAKFQELLVVQDIAGGNIDSANDNIAVEVTNSDRITVLLTGMVAGATDQDHTIKFYKSNASGTGDVAIPFTYSLLTELTGAYGTWTDATAAAGLVIASADATLVSGQTLSYLFEIDKNEFDCADDFATPLQYLGMKITGTNDTATWTAGATAILYGLKYKNED